MRVLALLALLAAACGSDGGGGDEPPPPGEDPPAGEEDPRADGEDPPADGDDPPGDGEDPPGDGDDPPGDAPEPPLGVAAGAGPVDEGGCGATTGPPAAEEAPPCTGVTAAGGAVLCVDAAADADSADGTAAAPFATIQAAVDAASPGDSVHVAAGAYVENVRVDRELALLGGFPGGGEFGTRSSLEHATCIDGGGADSVVTLVGAGDSRVDGFHLSNGVGSSVEAPYLFGAGIYVSEGSPTLSNNVIEGNDSGPDTEASWGGGISTSAAEAVIEGNVIRNNVAGRGAGISAFEARIVIRRNTVVNNTGEGDHGGGIYVSAPDIEISDNYVAGNVTGAVAGYGWGGGILVFDAGSKARLHGNVVTDNFAPSIGGGVFIDDGAEATMEHELVYRNRCQGEEGLPGGAGIYVDGQGYGDDVPSKLEIRSSTIAFNRCATETIANALYVEQDSTATVVDTIFWGNGDDVGVGGELGPDDQASVEVRYSLSAEGLPGEGNLTSDPGFADPEADDYHLRSVAGRWSPSREAWVEDGTNSPALDAGDPASAFDLEPADNGGRINMGAYGNTEQASLSP